MKITHYTAVVLTILLASCSSIKRLPQSEDPCYMGEIAGMPDIRFWGDDAAPENVERIATIRDQITSDPSYNKDAPIHFLALSGGGQNGAYGAGLLSGWTASGTRPEFRMVTGISTGALIAPFAFLGPDYDTAIRDMYSKFSTKDVLKKRYIKGLFSGDSITDNAPLRNIIKSYLTPMEMEKISKEHERGRRLFVGTTYLDVQRPVIWDIGAIASSGHPDAYDLMIDVLIASTSIPGAFPPIYIEAKRNEERYDELHVDGGVTTQIFITPVSFKMENALLRAGLHGQAHVYLIRNTSIAPEVTYIKPKTVPILTQSLSTLLRAQGLGDMYRIYQDAQLNNMTYNAAYVPSDFRDTPDEMFDIDYMTELFELAYNQAKNGYPWHTEPPEFQHISPRGPE